VSIHFWILNFFVYLPIFLSAIIFLKPKLTVKNAAIGLVTVAAQVLTRWLFFMFMPSVIQGIFWNVVNLFISTLILFALYRYSKDFLYSCYCWVLALLVEGIAMVALYVFQMHLLGVPNPAIWLVYLLRGLSILLQLSIAITVKRSFTKLPFFSENRVFMYYASLMVISIAIVQNFVVPSLPSGGIWSSYMIFKILTILTFIVLAFWQQRDFYKKEIEKQRVQYVGEIEMQHFAIRSFRHDYINVLLTMDQYIKEDDMVGLKQYFNNEIMPTRTLLENQNIELGNLGKLQSKEIKSLLSVKIMEAQSLGINTIVEIPEVVEEINMKLASLARVLGVFLDNAIEACKEELNSQLRVMVFEKMGSQLIVVKNTCGNRMPTVKQVFEKGFSTKGSSRGLGLYNVRQLLDKEDHVTLTTVIEDGYFIQALKINGTAVNAVLLGFD